MTAPPSPPSRFFVIGDVVADPERNLLLRHGEIVKLEPRVMAVLAYLAANPGRVVGKDELLARVWNGVHVVDEAVQRAVSLLRAALDDDPRRPRLIETVPTRGYRLMIAPHPLGEPVAVNSSGFAGSRPLALVLAALLAGLILGAVTMEMRRTSLEHIAPPAPTPTPQALQPQPAPPAPVG
ncbi:MAG: transcriptional regulator [Caulobacteraceae bacterium]|nr:transcriptional regulator [Caulobacteraceae bacterium]